MQILIYGVWINVPYQLESNKLTGESGGSSPDHEVWHPFCKTQQSAQPRLIDHWKHIFQFVFKLFLFVLFNCMIAVWIKVVFHTKNFFSYLTIFQSYLSWIWLSSFYRYRTSHFYLFCCYSNLEMTSYRTKYRVCFKKDLIRTKLLGISKTTLIDSWKNILCPEQKKTEFRVSNLHCDLFNRYIEEKLYQSAHFVGYDSFI